MYEIPQLQSFGLDGSGAKLFYFILDGASDSRSNMGVGVSIISKKMVDIPLGPLFWFMGP